MKRVCFSNCIRRGELSSKKKQQFLKALYIFSFFVGFVFTSWLSLKLMMARNYRKIRLEVEKKENEKR
jgi:hypothetical protein